MKISKTLGLQDGKAIVRVLPKVKAIRNIYVAVSAIDFYSAVTHAKRGEGFNTIVMGGLCMFFMKQTEKLQRAIKILQPRYDEIVARARKIHFKD